MDGLLPIIRRVRRPLYPPEPGSVARKPVDDATNPDYWLIQPNEYFPLKCSRLDRLNVIIDGQVDRAALEAVKMNHVAIFSRSR